MTPIITWLLPYLSAVRAHDGGGFVADHQVVYHLPSLPEDAVPLQETQVAAYDFDLEHTIREVPVIDVLHWTLIDRSRGEDIAPFPHPIETIEVDGRHYDAALVSEALSRILRLRESVPGAIYVGTVDGSTWECDGVARALPHRLVIDVGDGYGVSVAGRTKAGVPIGHPFGGAA